MSTFRLDRVFNPKTVAVVGGSTREKSLGRIVLRNLRAAGFEGQLCVLNPRHPEIDGLKTCRDLSELPCVPDVVVVTAPAAAVPGIIDDCGMRGVAGAIVISAGLGHGAGSHAEKAASAARKHGIRLVGPNGLGVIVPRAKFNASFAAKMPNDGDLAVISQSGAVAAGLVEWASRRSVGFSAVVSLGDAVDVDFGDTLDFFALDAGTRAILLYIESISDAPKFMAAARAAARIKPVVVVKSGRFAQGARAAATHTGALAGADAVYDAAFRRAGLLRVLDLDELFAAAETLGHTPPFAGRRLAILTNGGGVGVLAVDQLVALGGTVAELSARTKSELAAFLPPGWSGANPVDIIGDADAARYRQSLEVLAADEENDAVLVINVPTALASPPEAAKTVVGVIGQLRSQQPKPKPVFAVWVGDDPVASETFAEAGVPHFNNEADAVAGFMQLVRYREAQEALMATPPSMPRDFTPDVETARAVVKAAAASGRQWLDPIEITRLLEAYDIAINPAVLARDADEAASLAGPMLADYGAVVAKILSPEIVHKSEVGGVALNLRSADAVRAATAEMIARAQKMQPKAHITGVTLNPMIARPNARELIVGVADDPTFGPVIVFGAGGTAVEVVDDKALALPPLDLKLARDLIERPRVARLLRGYRNVPAADRDAIALTLVKISHLVADLPEIRELDLNPLLADEKGVVAIDARIAVAPVDRARGTGHPRMAIRSYPKEWERTLSLSDGESVKVRPVRPEDEPLCADFLGTVSDDDLRIQFAAPVHGLNHRFVARFTQIDYARGMALIAFAGDGTMISGAVRLQVRGEGTIGQCGLMLRPEYRDSDLGRKLMQLMLDYARSQSILRIEGSVLRTASELQAIYREQGFTLRPDPAGDEAIQVALDLERGAVQAAK